MPRYSAPGAIRRCHMPPLQFREPVPTYRRRAFAARPPGRDRRAPSCTSRVVTRKLGRRRSPTSPGADQPPPCSTLPPMELAFSGIDLDAVPVPRIEETSEPGTFTRPMPEQAAVLGQRGRQVLRPRCCDAAGGAVAAGPHAAADTYPLAFPRADHPELPAADQSRRPVGTCAISAGIALYPVESDRDAGAGPPPIARLGAGP
jgi:hypothetical protein